ncbi:SDR family NAD(P)-dependent oxidoreductase [Pararhodonellum marinum]|uniref:SDR family NAD(P)-dependent oxidoreductase n=1 Tax=Pararhodonellum marinum TaxID=2755358 RepID=UPI0018902A24|nr:SDR family NAD(P)-dependent oxidoreductase [Pararhodonellum marinum]
MVLAITGPTSGIGKETVKGLSAKFDKIFLLVRNEKKGAALVQSISSLDKNDKFKIVYCDLADLSSVRAAAENILKQTDKIDVLINNAGGIFTEKQLSKDKLDLTFSINHLGHFLLTTKLLPLLEKSVDARIINVSSEAHKAAKPKLNDLQMEQDINGFIAYANAKLYNIWFTKSLQDRYHERGIKSYALHPGVVKSNFGGDATGIFRWAWFLVRPFMISAEKGAETSIFLAKSPSIQQLSGNYFKKSKKCSVSSAAKSKKYRDKLWEVSEALVEQYR